MSPEQEEELTMGSQFNGLNLDVFTLAAENGDREFSGAVGQRSTVAVAIAAEVLRRVDENVLLRAMNRRPGGRVPLLIRGLAPETGPHQLSSCSGGTAVAAKRFGLHRAHYLIGHVDDITRQLSGIDLPVRASDGSTF